MKSPRHRAREVGFQILYRYDETQDSELPKTPAELLDELQLHFEHFQVPEETREFAARLVSGTLQNRNSIDKTIQTHSEHWRMERMSALDRNLLRLGTYELQYVPETPHPVVINEIVELAKQFSTPDSSQFINAILDAIYKSGPKT